jgi:outer membrane receptor protein involved in Fe transport
MIHPLLSTRTTAVLALTASMLAMPAGLSHAAEPSAEELTSVLAEPVYGSARLAGASKYAQDLAEAPTVVYVRTAGEIRTQGYRTLAEVLESVPGVHLRSDRIYSHAGVRGINPPGDYSARLLVLIDGVRTNEAIYDSATLGREFPLDIGLIERVEFIPGPGSALYGSNAVLGVVNVITRSPSQLPGLNAVAEASGGARRKLAVTWGGDAGPVRLLLGGALERSRGHDLYFPEFDQPPSTDGWARGQDGERNDKLFLKARWSDLTLSAQLSDRTKRDPTASYGTLFNRRSDSADRYALADLAYARALDEHREIYARIGVARYRYWGYGEYDQGGTMVPGESRSGADWSAGELRYVWSGWAYHRVLLGLEFQDNRRQALRSEDLEPAPFVYSDLNLNSARHSLFVNDEWQVTPRLRLNLGLRADRRLDGRVTTTPRLAALWTPTPAWTLKLQRGSAFREPNVSETHYADGTQIANTSLKVESLVSHDAAVLWRPHATFGLSASLYELRIRDLINLVDLPDGSGQYVNAGRSRARGLQTEATWEPGAGVQWRVGWSRQRASDADTRIDLPDAPRSLLKVAVTVPLPLEGARLGANLQRIGARRTLAGATLPAHAQLNLQFTHAPLGQRWSVGVGIVNLTDRRRLDPAGPEHVQDALVQDGREIVVRLGWSF